MYEHRTTSNNSIKLYLTKAPFSSFSFVEKNFKGIYSLRRCFSLARALGVKTLTLEDIPAKGIIEDENKEILEFFPNYRCKGVVRLCFWKKEFKEPSDISSLSNRHLIGYAILKHDSVKSKKFDRWHIFEAVFKIPSTMGFYITMPKSFKITCNQKGFCVNGILYCQQNSLNKACAQVALRTLLSNHISQDISYKQINTICGITPQSGRKPSMGMGVSDIRAVLNNFKIGFKDIDYTQNERLRYELPYQKFLYAGIESGAGALLGFHLSGPSIQDNLPPRHIIPFFGHTFNQHTWVPDSKESYFDVGGGVGYLPSDNWTDSFIGHDDNFGPNYCVPTCHVKRESVDYVVELFNSEVRYSGVHAEAVALGFVYSLVRAVDYKSSNNIWIKRLLHFTRHKKIVLRAVFVSKKRYLRHLLTCKDWEGNKERYEFIEGLEDVLPSFLWIIEISLPQLFPANERKVGEVVLNPYIKPNISTDVDFDLFLLARIPCYYFFLDSLKENNPTFLLLKSNITSHMPLIKHR